MPLPIAHLAKLRKTRIFLSTILWVLILFIPASNPLLKNKISPRVFLIGNSLTWDTVPQNLEGTVNWHIACGRNLSYIFHHPETTCVKPNFTWTKYLPSQEFEFISFQPFYEDTLERNLSLIEYWMNLQPNAIVIIHPGWAHHKRIKDEYTSNTLDPNNMHNPTFITSLITALTKRFPTRYFRTTYSTNLIKRIFDDIEKQQSPFLTMEDIYRDKIHLRGDTGRYLMHNAMRRTLGQPLSKKGFESLELNKQRYLDQILLEEVPEEPPISQLGSHFPAQNIN